MLSALLQGGSPQQQSLQTLTVGRGALGAGCSLPKNSSPGEGSSPASTSPLPLCPDVTWMLFFASWFGAPQTAATARLWGSRKEKATASGTSLLLLGKQGKIRKRKCKGHCIHRLPIDLPFQEKRECADMLQLFEFPAKACRSSNG